MLRIEAENFDASVSCQLSQYFIGLPRPQKNCLASVSTSLSRSRLGMHLSWLVLIVAALVVTVALTPSSLLIFMFTVLVYYHILPTVYFLHLGHVANPRPIARIKIGHVRMRLLLVSLPDRSLLWRPVLDLQRAPGVFLYGFLVRALPWHCLGLLLPRLEH